MKGGRFITQPARTWPRFDEVTAGFSYARLHGDFGYSPEALDEWAERVRR